MVWARVGVGGAPGTVYAGGPPGMPLTAQSLYRSWLRVEAAATRGDVPAVPPGSRAPSRGLPVTCLRRNNHAATRNPETTTHYGRASPVALAEAVWAAAG
jgi:hypothetical protein